jgi:predicted alpha/beta superfamily hydrolase
MSNDAAARLQVEGGFEKTVCSGLNGLEYRILISRPKSDPPAGGYPVIYALDGDAVFGTLSEAARLQTRKPRGFDPVVIVGIGYPSREPFDMNRRCYDFTTPAPRENLPVRPGGEDWPRNGGADVFLQFIEQELRPMLEKEYPIDVGRQTLFGHSLGGLFVLHALFSRPDSFQNYVAGSPSAWWNHRAVFREKERFACSFPLPYDSSAPRLMLTIGEDELEGMVEDAERLQASLQPLAVHGFHSELVKFPGEGHVSVLPAALSRTVRFALTASL